MTSMEEMDTCVFPTKTDRLLKSFVTQSGREWDYKNEVKHISWYIVQLIIQYKIFVYS